MRNDYMELSHLWSRRQILASFIAYCKAHPSERFWQALRNWSGFHFILGSSEPPFMIEERLGVRLPVIDTFYFEGRNLADTGFSIGTVVQTTQANEAMRGEWTDDGWKARKWGVTGPIITEHNSHGLCYGVRHPDGTIGCYDPSEIKRA